MSHHHTASSALRISEANYRRCSKLNTIDRGPGPLRRQRNQTSTFSPQTTGSALSSAERYRGRQAHPVATLPPESQSLPDDPRPSGPDSPDLLPTTTHVIGNVVTASLALTQLELRISPFWTSSPPFSTIIPPTCAVRLRPFTWEAYRTDDRRTLPTRSYRIGVSRYAAITCNALRQRLAFRAC